MILKLSAYPDQNARILTIKCQPTPASPATRPSSVESPAPGTKESATGAQIKRSFSTQFVDSCRPLRQMAIIPKRGDRQAGFRADGSRPPFASIALDK